MRSVKPLAGDLIVYERIEDEMTDAGKFKPGMQIKQLINYKYNEGDILQEVQAYVDSTYGQHYVGNGEVQTVDFWESLGSLDTTARDTAIKYLARFGKKGGNNRKDLLKAIHYIILMMYATREDSQ